MISLFYSLNAGISEYFLDDREGVIARRMAGDPRTLLDLSRVDGCMMGLPSPTVSLCPPPCPLESTTVRPSPKGLRFPPISGSRWHSSNGPQQSHVPTWDMAVRPSHVGDQCPDPSALFSGTSCPGSLQGNERDNRIVHSSSITTLGHSSHFPQQGCKSSRLTSRGYRKVNVRCFCQRKKGAPPAWGENVGQIGMTEATPTITMEGRYGQENGGHRWQQPCRYVGAHHPTLGLATIQIRASIRHETILEAPAADILPSGVPA